ncbi:putative ABC transport system ATP-binding protein [Streptosporangium becharense]|uniref:Putative ABC transport system ATP-binding protein n=1 Tax=Streptosporangium becharense TaxID=1816182 RepID=A0A7W9MET1_9ACTN|nr:ABC transporter ATP-binding protein [Streptosporangium becharense]MBB2915618.1 putative ABC transport system ATP-binding protein [Streptosporangium becharense]MBB5818110.1 putative ABC transport system ATP-binding protein [Streptosporangium becharense]
MDAQGIRTENEGADEIVRLDSVRKTYRSGTGQVVALGGVTIGCPRGSLTAIIGPSGSGKSTLLQCAAGLDRPTSGTVLLDGEDLTGLDEAALTRLRRDRVGFIFQTFNLLPALDVEENVTLPLSLAGRRPDPSLLVDVMRRVGLAGHTRHRPAELSPGQRQRAAIARALITRRTVIFADEPTGALDARDSGEILDLLRDTVRETGQTVLMASHDPLVASYADRVAFLSCGRIIDELNLPMDRAVARRMTHLGLWDRLPDEKGEDVG